MSMVSLTQQIYEKLKNVIDPELGLNIVELGLVYRVVFHPQSDDTAANQRSSKEKSQKPLSSEPTSVEIVMTLTSPLCPVGPLIMDEVKKQVSSVLPVVVTLVWDPPWSQDKLSDDIKLQLGLL